LLVGVNIGLMQLSAPAKRGYHHGDLRNALAEAAATLAKEGGPESVTVRAAARLVGVTPTAAYRHYSGHEELLAEAKHQCLARLGVAMRQELDGQPTIENRLHRALRNMAAAGRAYVDFALAEPGLFRTAFCQGGAVLGKDHAEEQADRPFGLLVGLLDELVDVGFLPAERRPLAEAAAWSTVHGLAMLLLDGPLRDVPPHIREEAITRTLVIMGQALSTTGLTPELEETIRVASRPATATSAHPEQR
jgi:AcrR family transcriptional regulator